MENIVKQFKESISKLISEEFKKIWDEIEAEIGTDYPVFNAKTNCFEYKINNTETIENGVKFAQKWIDINKESPQYYQNVLADNGEYITVVAKVSDGNEDFYPICGTHVCMYPDPIKWRPIELK